MHDAVVSVSPGLESTYDGLSTTPLCIFFVLSNGDIADGLECPLTRALQFGQKVPIIFDSIRQSDKFAACTLVFK